MTEQTEKTARTVAEQLKPYQFQKGVSGNPNGRPKGSKDFSTMFEEAIKIIVKEQRIPVKDPEVELVVKGVTQALRGNYSFWKDIMDRTYGSTNSNQTNVAVQVNNFSINKEDLISDAIEILEQEYGGVREFIEGKK